MQAIYKTVKNELGAKSEISYWVLISRDVIPESRSKTYDAQKKLVANYAQKSGVPYVLPKALDAATAIFMHYVETGEYLYTDRQKGSERTYTRCQETVYETQWPVAIGCFSSKGLDIASDGSLCFDNNITGVMASKTLTRV